MHLWHGDLFALYKCNNQSLSINKSIGQSVHEVCSVFTLQVLIRVHATGVNPVDTYIRAGVFAHKPSLPYTPGSDAAGVVEAVGKKVTNFKVKCSNLCVCVCLIFYNIFSYVCGFFFFLFFFFHVVRRSLLIAQNVLSLLFIK
jgi:hypothetical protein